MATVAPVHPVVPQLQQQAQQQQQLQRLQQQLQQQQLLEQRAQLQQQREFHHQQQLNKIQDSIKTYQPVDLSGPRYYQPAPQKVCILAVTEQSCTNEYPAQCTLHNALIVRHLPHYLQQFLLAKDHPTIMVSKVTDRPFFHEANAIGTIHLKGIDLPVKMRTCYTLGCKCTPR